MPDELDRAAQLEQEQRQRALAAQRARADFAVPSAQVCEDCDETIPAARRRLGGVTRCVSCQQVVEQQRRWRGRQ